MQTMDVRRHGAVGEIRFNRPQMLNAFGGPWPQELRAASAELEADPEVRAVIVTGEGRAFSSGLDLDEQAAGRITTEWFADADRAMRSLELLAKPVLAGIQGWCLGGGVQVAIACDVRLAADDAVFGLGAVKLGFLSGMSFWRLPRLIGMGWARHLILSGERIGATEAERIGLVHRVVARPELENELHAWAKRYAEVPPASLAWAKRLCNAAFDVPFDPAFEALGEGMAALLDTDDDLAARRAWLERRRRRPS